MRRREKLVLAAGVIGAAFIAGRHGRKAGPPEPGADAGPLYDLAKVSYDQVLDATKHQDDKVGRFLTAIAFLTAAAIAFGTRSDVLGVQYNLDGLVPLPGVLFAGFIALVVVAVVFLLMALGTALRVPGTGSADDDGSLLFFLVISGETLEQWKHRWTRTPAEIREDLTKDLVSETYNIATRADKKYLRTGEAQAIFTLALLLFSLAVALAINVLATQAKAPAQWDLRSRLVAITVLTSFAISLGYGWVRSGQMLEKKSQWPLYALWWLASVFPAVVLLPPRVLPAHLGAAVAATVVLAGGFCAAATLPKGFAQSATAALTVALAGLTGASVWREAERWRLGLACATVALLEVPRLLSATFTWQRRRAGLGAPRGGPRGQPEVTTAGT